MTGRWGDGSEGELNGRDGRLGVPGGRAVTARSQC